MNHCPMCGKPGWVSEKPCPSCGWQESAEKTLAAQPQLPVINPQVEALARFSQTVAALEKQSAAGIRKEILKKIGIGFLVVVILGALAGFLYWRDLHAFKIKPATTELSQHGTHYSLALTYESSHSGTIQLRTAKNEEQCQPKSFEAGQNTLLCEIPIGHLEMGQNMLSLEAHARDENESRVDLRIPLTITHRIQSEVPAPKPDDKFVRIPFTVAHGWTPKAGNGELKLEDKSNVIYLDRGEYDSFVASPKAKTENGKTETRAVQVRIEFEGPKGRKSAVRADEAFVIAPPVEIKLNAPGNQARGPALDRIAGVTKPGARITTEAHSDGVIADEKGRFSLVVTAGQRKAYPRLHVAATLPGWTRASTTVQIPLADDEVITNARNAALEAANARTGGQKPTAPYPQLTRFPERFKGRTLQFKGTLVSLTRDPEKPGLDWAEVKTCAKGCNIRFTVGEDFYTPTDGELEVVANFVDLRNNMPTFDHAIVIPADPNPTPAP